VSNLNKLLQILLKAELDFVIVGGFAGVVHGSTRVTKDLDICISMKPRDLDLLRTILSPYHPRHRMNPQSKMSFLEVPKTWDGLKNLYLETDLGILDVLGEITGVGAFEKLKASSIVVELFSSACRVISIDDLIISKRSMGRERDLLDAKELEAIRAKQG